MKYMMKELTSINRNPTRFCENNSKHIKPARRTKEERASANKEKQEKVMNN